VPDHINKSKLSAHERLKAFHARNLQYLRLGYDRANAARFVVRAAGELAGPALDIGTGKGLCAVELARTGMNVVSVDVDVEEQEVAALVAEKAGVGGRIHFVHGNAAHLPYPDGYFGCAAMMDALHHLDEPSPVFREMARVVKDGGLIIIADFDEKGFDLLSRVHRAEGHDHPRTAATLIFAQDELLRAGFQEMARTTSCLHDVIVLLRKPRNTQESD